MDKVIPGWLDLALLLVVPVVVLIITLRTIKRRQDIRYTSAESLLLSLVVSSVVACLYFGFDFFFLKRFVDGCSDLCGIENIFFAVFVGVIGFASLIIFLIKKTFSNSVQNSTQNISTFPDDVELDLLSTKFRILKYTPFILLLELIRSIIVFNPLRVYSNEGSLFGTLMELFMGPIIYELSTILLIVAVYFFFKKDFLMSKMVSILSLVFVVTVSLANPLMVFVNRILSLFILIESVFLTRKISITSIENK